MNRPTLNWQDFSKLFTILAENSPSFRFLLKLKYPSNAILEHTAFNNLWFILKKKINILKMVFQMVEKGIRNKPFPSQAFPWILILSLMWPRKPLLRRVDAILFAIMFP